MTTRHGGNIPTEAGAGGGGSGLTSVDVALTGYSSDGPLVADGTISLTEGAQSGNKVKASPSNGSSGTPAYRALVAADIPSLSGTYQPLDADLTAIAALTTTSYGRNLLTLADGLLDADLDPRLDATISFGSSSLRFVEANYSTGVFVWAALGDAIPQTAILGARIEFGPGGASATDTVITRASAGVVAIGGANILVSGGALGTPSSGVLTNATGLPASALVSGIVAENVAIDLDGFTLTADGKYKGLTTVGTAGTTLAFGDLCYLAVADSRWELTDADAAATAGGVPLGMCVLAAAGDGSATKMLLVGVIRADAKFPALTVGASVYVSTSPGEIQVAQPSGTDDVIRIVGEALTADSIMFQPSRDWMTHN